MKAIDYYNKYRDRLLEVSTGREAANDLVHEMVSETQQLVQNRHVVRRSGIVAAINESCEKYEALCRLFQKRDVKSPLATGGLRRLWAEIYPNKQEA